MDLTFKEGPLVRQRAGSVYSILMLRKGYRVETDTLTQAESKWLDALESLLDRQPKTIRIMVRNISLDACRPDDVRAFFQEHGNVDNVPDLWSLLHEGKFQPCGESE